MKDAFLPTLGGQLSIEVRDPRGSLISQHSQPIKRYVANFNRLVRCQLMYKTGVTQVMRLTAMSGISQLVDGPSAEWLSRVGNQGSFEGILIGTSPRAVQGTDYKLGTPYRPGGTTANRFTHNVGTWISETKAVGTLTYRYQRSFTNNTALSLTVNEVGFAPSSDKNTVALATMIIRDTILATSVPSLATITVTYDLFAVK